MWQRSYGDRIIPGAFEKSIARWAEKGDRIPVTWAHQWQDPDCHVGVVEKAEERPGEGLWVRGRLDLDQAKASEKQPDHRSTAQRGGTS